MEGERQWKKIPSKVTMHQARAGQPMPVNGVETSLPATTSNAVGDFLKLTVSILDVVVTEEWKVVTCWIWHLCSSEGHICPNKLLCFISYYYVAFIMYYHIILPLYLILCKFNFIGSLEFKI